MSKTIDTSKFLHLLSAGKQVESDMREAMDPYVTKLQAIREEQDALATLIGKESGPGTYRMGNGELYKVRQYKGKKGEFYFLPYVPAEKGIKGDFSKAEQDSDSE